MMSPEAQDLLRRVYQYTPQLEQLLEFRLQEELNDLPNISLDKVQIFQGRALALRELLADLRHASGVMANRTAKPNFSTP